MTSRILFVCLGNICRSPTAEGVARRMGADHGGGRADLGNGWAIDADRHVR